MGESVLGELRLASNGQVWGPVSRSMPGLSATRKLTHSYRFLALRNSLVLQWRIKGEYAMASLASRFWPATGGHCAAGGAWGKRAVSLAERRESLCQRCFWQRLYQAERVPGAIGRTGVR